MARIILAALFLAATSSSAVAQSTTATSGTTKPTTTAPGNAQPIGQPKVVIPPAARSGERGLRVGEGAADEPVEIRRKK